MCGESPAFRWFVQWFVKSEKYARLQAPRSSRTCAETCINGFIALIFLMLFEAPEGAILLYSLRRPRRAAEGVPLTGQATTNVDTHAYESDDT